MARHQRSREWLNKIGSNYHAKRQTNLLDLLNSGFKHCPKCKKDLPVANFQVDKKKFLGLRSQCKECSRDYQAKQQRKNYLINRKKILAKSKWYRAKHEFKLSKENYYKMLSEQHGVCAICKSPPKEGKMLYIDHNHKTSTIRGLLCHGCNAGLGLLKDSVSILRTAAEYLEKRGSYGA